MALATTYEETETISVRPNHLRTGLMSLRHFKIREFGDWEVECAFGESVVPDTNA